MNDGIIFGNGTSRLIRANLPATYEEFRTMAAAGTLPLDVLFNAAGWRQQPTFLNAANLLKAQTAALFGLDETAVPDDVLVFLGKYNQHWWMTATDAYEINKNTGRTVYFTGNHRTNTVTYADSITFDASTGAITLVAPQTVEIVDGTDDELSAQGEILLGKYVTHVFLSGTGPATDEVYFIPEGASVIGNATYGNSYVNIAVWQRVTLDWQQATIQYIMADSQDAYPETGTVNGVTYQYLGVPFDKSVTAPRLAVGSYMGTGTYGADNPTSLTFEFEPQLLFVFPNDSWLFNGNRRLTAVRGQKATSLRDASSSSVYIPVVLNWDGKTVSWYTTLGEMDAVSGADQLNAGNAEYFYAALG